MEKETILGFDVCTANKQNLLENIFKDYKAGIQRFIVNINPEIVTSNYKNEDYKKALNKCDLEEASEILLVLKELTEYGDKRFSDATILFKIN